MAVRERDARSRFQVTLEGERTFLVSELDDDINRPRTEFGRMRTLSGVVTREPRSHICRNTCVVARRCVVVLEHIHKPLWHESSLSKGVAAQKQTRFE